jgi:hypothetical protein
MHSFLLVAWLVSGTTNLVTGNGFGFAVVSPQTATITKFYAHPYSFSRPDPRNPLGEGIETTSFIRSLRFPCDGAQHASAEYLRESHVIEVSCGHTKGFVFMPFGVAQAALVVDWEPGAVQWSHKVQSRRLVAGECEVLTFERTEESLVVIPLHPGRAFISVESGSDPVQAVETFNAWRSDQRAVFLVLDEIRELETWRVPAPNGLSKPELNLWRQSETMLRMAQSREPNENGRYGNGLIVASLPDGVWFTPWVRDMTWAAMALTRMGHRAEARAALLAYFNARPTGKMRAEVQNADYQVSVVRYFGDGSEEPFFTMEGSPNIEFDDWGEVLWLLGEYMRTYHDTALLSEPTARGPLYQSARDFVVAPLLANMQPYKGGLILDEDTSIWEEHQKDKKHFAFSTGMAIVGLKSFSPASDTIALLEKGFAAAFIRGGTLHGTLEEGEKNDIDGALLELIHLGVVTDTSVVRSTVERMELLKVASGGYRRVRSNYTDPAIFEYWYERQEFLFVDFSLAEVARRPALVQRIVDKAAADHNIIPEMYVALPCKLFPGQIGDPTGAKPMVGYGAGAYILDVLDRASHGP